MHKYFVQKKPLNENTHVSNLLIELKNELEFQKTVHLHAISLLDENEKTSYILRVQSDYISYLFNEQVEIIEKHLKYFENLIKETIQDFSQLFNEFNLFIYESLRLKYYSLTEQLGYSNPGGYPEIMKRSAESDLKKVNSALQSAVTYIREKGLTYVFETLRNALMSGVGTAIQIALSFTGVGAIANEVAWGIMTLYDAYQYFVNNTTGSLSNLIIDLICLLTAGSLGKVLKGFVNFAANSITAVISKFMQSGLGQSLKPIVKTIEGGASAVSNFLSSASQFMKDKMGIGWVSGQIDKVKKFFLEMSIALSKAIGGAAAKAASSVIRAGVKLGNKFEVSVFQELSKKSEQQLAREFRKTITKSKLNAADKYAKEYLRDRKTQDALNLLDNQFGTDIGDIYALYVDSKKLGGQVNKINRGITGVDVGTDLLRGDVTTNKVTKYANQVQKDLNKF